jgi:hypothetical protein
MNQSEHGFALDLSSSSSYNLNQSAVVIVVIVQQSESSGVFDLLSICRRHRLAIRIKRSIRSALDLSSSSFCNRNQAEHSICSRSIVVHNAGSEEAMPSKTQGKDTYTNKGTEFKPLVLPDRGVSWAISEKRAICATAMAIDLAEELRI